MACFAAVSHAATSNGKLSSCGALLVEMQDLHAACYMLHAVLQHSS